MTPETHQAFAELRSLCQRPHSQKTWSEILDCLRQWPDEATRDDLAVPYVHDHLNHWPDEYRNCDEHAIELLKSGERPAYYRVLKHLGDVNKWVTKHKGIVSWSYNNAEDIEWIASSELMQHIKSLNLRNHQLDDPALDALTNSQHLHQLEALDLGGNSWTADGFKRFAQNMEFSNLKHLALWKNTIKDEGIKHLVNNPSMTNVNLLELGECLLTAKSVEFIADSPYFEHLSVLCLWENRLDQQGIIALTHPKFRNLRELEIQNTGLTIEAWSTLLSSNVYDDLTWLSLDDNVLGDEGMELLCQSDTLRKLEYIRLSNTKLTDDGLHQFCNSEQIRHMKRLSVDKNNIPNVFEHLANSSTLQRLKTLNVSRSKAKMDALADCFGAEHFSELEELWLVNNKMSYKGFHRAFQMKHLPPLNNLVMEGVENFGPACARTLGRANLPELETIYLSRSSMTDKTINHLFQSTTMPKLKSLYIGEAQLTDATVEYLVDSPILNSLENLGLWTNRLTDKSIDLLTSHQCFEKLQYININQNYAISSAARQKLSQAENLSASVRAYYS